MPISSNSVNWKSIGLHPLLVFEGFTHHLLDAEKLVRVGVDVLVFSGILQLPLTEGFNILRQVGGSKVIMAICWRYFLSSYVFCVIGDHFWAGKNHSSELRTCCATTIITYTRTKRYEKRDPFIPPVYHPSLPLYQRTAADNIDAQLILLTYNSLGNNGLTAPSLLQHFIPRIHTKTTFSLIYQNQAHNSSKITIISRCVPINVKIAWLF